MQGYQEPGIKPLAELVNRNFPAIDYGFAYGSGVFVQPDLYQAHHKPGAASGPMLDFIFVVQDPHAWHTQVRRCRLYVVAIAVPDQDVLRSSTLDKQQEHNLHYNSCLRRISALSSQ
jgi:hypothetical protein